MLAVIWRVISHSCLNGPVGLSRNGISLTAKIQRQLVFGVDIFSDAVVILPFCWYACRHKYQLQQLKTDSNNIHVLCKIPLWYSSLLCSRFTLDCLFMVDIASNNSYLVVYTLCPKKRSHFYFLNNSVNNEPILIIFGILNPEETWH